MLPAEDRLKIYDALFEYALDDVEPELPGVLGSLMVLMRPNIDASIKRQEDGAKGGRPKTSKSILSEKTETPKSILSEESKSSESILSANRKPPESIPFKDKEKEEEKEKDKDKEKEEENARAEATSFVLSDGSAFYPPAEKLKEYQQAFPDVDVRRELLRAAIKHNARDQRKNITNIELFIANWLTIAQADAQKARSGTSFTKMETHDPVTDDQLMRELRERGNLV